MNLTRAEKVRLGAFLVVGFGLLAGVSIWLVGSAMWAEVDSYTVRFRESVSGLDISSAVKYQGLRIGRVASMGVANDDPGAIEVALAIRPGTVLREGTKASLDKGTLTGLATVNLSPGDPRGAIIPPGSMLPAGLSFTDEISGKAESIRVKFETLSNQLLRWTSDVNRARAERLLDDTDTLVRNLDATVVALRPELLRASRKLGDAGAGAVRLSHASTRTLRVAKEVIKSTGTRSQASFDELDRVLKGVDPGGLMSALAAAQSAARRLESRLASDDINKAFAGMQGAIDGVRSALQTVSRLLASVELALTAARGDTLITLRRLRESSEDLRTFSRDIARDPALILRGREASK